MYRSLAVSIALAVILAACAPAATPTQAPAGLPPTAAPAAQPTQAPAAVPQWTQAPTIAAPDLRPPRSGGPMNPPTLSPGVPGARVNARAPKGWEQLGSQAVPPARYDHALVFAGDFNRLVLFGGRSKTAFGDTWIYDLAANAWRQVKTTPAPEARYSLGAAYDANRQRVLLFGGRTTETFQSGLFNDVWSFDLHTEQWNRLTTTGAIPQPRYGSSVVIDPQSDRLFISHGFTSRSFYDDTAALRLATHTWQDLSPEDRPPARMLPAAVFDARHRKLVLFGGQDGQGNLLADLWLFDLATEGWTESRPAGEKPAARSSATLVDDGKGALWLFGGQSSTGASGELWRLDPGAGQWTLIQFSGGPRPRSNHAAAWDSINNRLIVFGGLDAQGNALNDVWAYTP